MGGTDVDIYSAQIIETIPALRSYALYLVKHKSQADDLVQDTLERAWRHRTSFQTGTNLRAWLFGILRNRFLDEVRRDRFTLQDADGVHAARLASPPNQYWRLQYEDLLSAIQVLAPEVREALVLVIGSGLSHEDAAQILGCPVGTLKARVRRAKANLLHIVELYPE